TGNSTRENGPARLVGGGGIFTSVENVTLSNSTVSRNRTAASGGGIFAGTGTIALDNSTVTGNLATGNGGGIFAQSGPVTLARSTVSLNRATLDGGGIAELGLTTTVSVLNNSSVRANVAGLPQGTAGGRGGGIFSAGVFLTNSTVSGNTAFGDGGGFFAP